MKSEIDRMVNGQRTVLRKTLVDAAEGRCLSISPDNWTDNHRRISYVGATPQYVGEQHTYHSIDLSCVKFDPEEKTAENIYTVN